MLQKTIDYVFSPNTTVMSQDGVTQGILIGTKKYLFVAPKNSIAGAGRKITTTKYEIKGQKLAEVVTNLLNEPGMSVAEFEDMVKAMLPQDAQAIYVVDLDQVGTLKVRTSFFSKGIYYKIPGKFGWKGYPISGKQNALEFQAFYQSRCLMS